MKTKLHQLEAIIEAGETAAIESGKALRVIRDERLYKPAFSTFDNYLDSRWKFTRQRAAQLIQIAIIAQSLSTKVDISRMKERHIREMAKLPAERRSEAANQFIALPVKAQTTKAMVEIVKQTEFTPVGKESATPLIEVKPDSKLFSPIGWYGGKTKLRRFITYLMPEHTLYCEPFFGGGSVLFAKAPSAVEIVSDLNNGVVTFFSVLRDATKAAELQRRLKLTPYSREEHHRCSDPKPTGDEIEDARRFFVRARQSYSCIENNGTWSLGICERQSRVGDFVKKVDGLLQVTERLRNVQVENQCFSKLLPKVDQAGAFIYADPPYPKSVRDGASDGYRCEMSDEQHEKLLAIITDFKNAKVMISGYRCPLYDDRLKNWNRHDKEVTVNASGVRDVMKARRTETIWKNY